MLLSKEVDKGSKRGQSSKVTQLLLKPFISLLPLNSIRPEKPAFWTHDSEKYCTLLPIYAVGFFKQAKRALLCFSWKDSRIQSSVNIWWRAF